MITDLREICHNASKAFLQQICASIRLLSKFEDRKDVFGSNNATNKYPTGFFKGINLQVLCCKQHVKHNGLRQFGPLCIAELKADTQSEIPHICENHLVKVFVLSKQPPEIPAVGF